MHLAAWDLWGLQWHVELLLGFFGLPPHTPCWDTSLPTYGSLISLL